MGIPMAKRKKRERKMKTRMIHHSIHRLLPKWFYPFFASLNLLRERRNPIKDWMKRKKPPIGITIRM
jgi:hypothetical protein